MSDIDRLFGRHGMRQQSGGTLGLKLKGLVRASDLTGPERRDTAKLGRKISGCAVTQRFWIKPDDEGVSRFHFMNKRACATRICPACEHRRSKKASADLIATVGHLHEMCATLRLIFLTLTTRNRDFTEDGLRGMYADHVAALPRLFNGNERVRSAILGHWTQIEVAVRENGGKTFCGLHSHSLVAVDGAHYFDPGMYLTQPAWVEAWMQAARLPYKPICDVRIARDAAGNASPAAIRHVCVEASKYVCKPFFKWNGGAVTINARIALIIMRVLHRQRMVRADRIWIKAAKMRRAAVKHTLFENPGE